MTTCSCVAVVDVFLVLRCSGSELRTISKSWMYDSWYMISWDEISSELGSRLEIRWGVDIICGAGVVGFCEGWMTKGFRRCLRGRL